ncbi:MFS transporter [Clostridium fermenticellae]|uniref:MFS transporter n=1 Tax=Clostridium fermenticellae TaxID=2068654 RepID=A0A386H0A3_9CLOT|nr:MFS transporter [Clostridium fermenticellae]
MNNTIKKENFVLTKSLILLMAIACGVCVANLYYVQPLESQIVHTFNISQNLGGLAATVTQVGYALGLLFLVPLGDMSERKSLILRMLGLIIIFLIFTSFSPNYPLMLISMFIVGLTTIVPQIILPYAAHLAPVGEQGKIIGYIMSGLLIGILLSRTFSGILGSIFNWRIVYILAALLIAILFVFISKFFPKEEPTEKIFYTKILKSIPELVKNQPTLRESALNGFFLFGSFSIFWTSLIFLLETPIYNMGTKQAGLFGLLGIAGILIAPLVGKICDKKSPKFAVGIATVLSTVAYICFFIFGYNLYGLILGVIILDLGTQCGQVSNQARVQNLGDKTRSRNNTIFMFSYFVGGASGSFLGTLCWQYFRWYGVCTIGLIFQILALITHFIIYRKQKIQHV